MNKFLFLILFLFLRSTLFAAVNTVDVYFWNNIHSDESIKSVKLDVKKTNKAFIKNRKIKASHGDMLQNRIYKTSINRYLKDSLNNVYINAIEVKYNVAGGFDKTYRFDKNISLADEELRSILIYLKPGTKKKIKVYKRYRGRIRSDLRRYRNREKTSLKAIYGEDAIINNVSKFPINLDSNIGRGKYIDRIHIGSEK